MIRLRVWLIPTLVVLCSMVWAGCELDAPQYDEEELKTLYPEQAEQIEQAEREKAEQAEAANRQSEPDVADTPTVPATPTSLTKSGFLWKPVSESTGDLVVLLPSAYRGGRVASTKVYSGGAFLEQGRYTGDANGNRPHYRFSKSGASYGKNITVVATLQDGVTQQSWSVPDGARRTEY